MTQRLESEKLLCAGNRSYNEDYGDYLLLPNFGCWALADGLGGHGGGEVAAKAAVETVLDAFTRQPGMSTAHLDNYLLSANEAVIGAQSKQPRLANMRTTLTIAVSDYESLVWAHIGDTRLYYFHQGRESNRPLTKDHSVSQAMADAGDIAQEDIRFHEDRNRLLRALGSPDDFRPVVAAQPISLQPGDAFLLCTDGFWEFVEEPEMGAAVRQAKGAGAWLAAMQAQLQRKIVQRGINDNDNYSAIAVMVR